MSRLPALLLTVGLLIFQVIVEAVPIPVPKELSQTRNLKLKQLVSTARKRLENVQQDTQPKPRSLGQAWGHLGSIYDIHGWSSEALVCYQYATQFDQEGFRWFYLLGRLTYTTHPKQAVKALSQAIEIAPKYVPAYVYQVQALRRTGQVETAKTQIQKLKRLDPSNPLVYLWLGELAFAERRFEEASQQLQMALKHNPDQSEARTRLVQTYVALGDLKSANQHRLQALLPTQHRKIEDPVWQEVVDLGLSSRWFIERGKRYMRQKAFQRAANEFSMIISVAEDDPEIWFNYGISLYHTEEYATATTALESALALQTRLGDESQAPNFQQLLAECHHYLGLIYAQHDHPNQAISHQQKAIDFAPSNTVYRRHLAQVYWQTKMYQPAADQYRQIIQSQPSDAKALYRLGLMALKQGQLDAAISYFNRVLSISPNHTHAHGALGLIFFQLGERQKATAAYETILRIDPDHQPAQSMLQKIRSQP